MAPLDEPWQALATAASFVCIYGLIALLPRALALPVPISNITQCNHLCGFVITTARPHGISGWFRPKIVLWGTGCLNDKRACEHYCAACEVKVLDAVQLLCDSTSLPGPLESSHGFCRLVRPGCMIWASVLGVPVLLAAFLQVLSLCFFFHFNPQLVLAAPAILLALCTYGHQVTQTKNPLHKRIQLYREHMKKTKTYSATEMGASRSVHLCDLQEFYSTFKTFIGQRNSYYVVSNIIKPLTLSSKLSFAELVGPRSASYFYVSSRWKWEFSTVLTCLHAHASRTDARYWWEPFSCNRYQMIEEFGRDCIIESAYHKALSSPLFQGLVVAFPGLKSLRDQYLSRSWCLLELFIAFTQNNDGININSNDQDLERVLFCAPSGVLNRGQCSPDMCMECMELLTNLDLSDARASAPEDQLRIQSYIQEVGGWDVFNRILSSSFKKIIESVEHLASLHAERVKRQSLCRNFSQLLQRRGCDTLETCPPGPERSISAGHLGELQSFFASVLDNRDMYWVCDEIVKPLTETKQVSYAELVGCGMVRWFISHWWGMHFNLTVKSVLNHAKEQTGEDMRYWVCTFSNNQWKMSEEIPPLAPPSESSFYQALRSPSCLGTCMILDERVVPLSRAWCLFELLQTFLIQDEIPSRESLNILTSSGVMNSGKCSIDTAMAIGKQLTILNLQNAGASKDEDKRLIFTAVETAGGFAAINAKLRLRIRKVIGVVANQFDQDLQQLHLELGKQRAAFC
eukprot:s855_g33.t1